MHRRQRWHQKKRRARRALHLHNWLTITHTSQESDACPYPGLPFAPSSVTRIK